MKKMLRKVRTIRYYNLNRKKEIINIVLVN